MRLSCLLGIILTISQNKIMYLKQYNKSFIEGVWIVTLVGYCPFPNSMDQHTAVVHKDAKKIYILLSQQSVPPSTKTLN